MECGESAGFFGENGSLSPVACRGTGSTGLSRGICRFYPWGSAGNSGENGSLSPEAVHFPRGVESSGGGQQGMHWEVLSIQVL